MRRHRCGGVGVLAAAMLVGCGTANGSAPDNVSASSSARTAHWTALVHVKGPIDLAGPRRDGSFILAAAGRLWTLSRSRQVRRFAPAYDGGGGEPYIALAPPTGGGCSFGPGTVYALRLGDGRGVDAIRPGGAVERFARVTAPGLLDGIAFDGTGHFGHRLLITVNAGTRTTVDAVDCHGRVQAITSTAPRVEGGVAVAPASFGRFAGDLIAPDEIGGRIYAIDPAGKSALVANSGLPHGQDTGVESEAFVSGDRTSAFLADRLTPGNAHPGDDLVLRLGASTLRHAGARAGDLLVATEGGAETEVVSCGHSGCRVRRIADGPAIAHAEGHIAFR